MSESAATWRGLKGPALDVDAPRPSPIARLAALVDRDVVSVIAVRLAMVVAGALSTIVTIRWMTPGERGAYFLVYTLGQTLAQFGTFGLQSSNTYLVARARSLAGALLANSLWFALAAGGLGAALVALVLQLKSGATPEGLWLVVLLAPAMLFYMLGSNLLVGLQRIRTFNRFQLANSYGVLLCLAVAAAAGVGPRGYLAAIAFGMTVVCARLLWTIRRDTQATFAFRADVFREGLRFACKAYLATLCGFLVSRTNVFLLSALTSADQVGYYSVAAQVVDVTGLLPQSAALVLFPALITARAGHFRTTIRNVVIVAALLAVGCVTLAVFADPFVRLAFGPQFQPTASVLRWMMPGAFFLGLTSVMSQYLAASGFPLGLVAVWIGGGLVSAVAGAQLSARSAAVGAGAAFSLTHAAIFLAVLALSIAHARRQS